MLKRKIIYQLGILFIIFTSNTYNVRVIAKRILQDFWKKHIDCEEQLKSWHNANKKSVAYNLNGHAIIENSKFF